MPQTAVNELLGEGQVAVGKGMFGGQEGEDRRGRNSSEIITVVVSGE